MVQYRLVPHPSSKSRNIRKLQYARQTKGAVRVCTYKHMVQFVIAEVSNTCGQQKESYLYGYQYPVPVRICRQHKDQPISLDLDKVIKKNSIYVVVAPLLLGYLLPHILLPPRKTDQTHEDKKGGPRRAKKKPQEQLVNAATDNNT